ncbi:MAG: hypothetical protein F6K23_01085 [Okeania sp. SIO2C9]|uniref:hypothetical protein n=1 Tax=Okeania sp. SIO2C9 TaxID=2607791 RepID=UPI0013C1C380|nr:hypothetical protein [Okeania sp. SIO2C9]NEQ71797.1 hypothetical protein [Okeania sp. SIO2C9]
MKCVKCKTDNNLKERTEAGGRCKNCNHPFVFDPKAGSKFTDIFFNNSIETISSENTLFFTSKQLWYFIDKRLRKKGDIGLVVSLFLSFFLLPFIMRVSVEMEFNILPFLIIFVPLILYFIWATQYKNYQPKSRRSFAIAIQIIGGLILVAVLV